MIQVVFNQHWKKYKGNKFYLGYGAGSFNQILKLDIFSDDQKSSEQNLINFLKEQPHHFSGIIDSGEYIYAYVDQTRSYPIFYTMERGQIHLSNDARKLFNNLDKWDIDEISKLEFKSAGYVTDKDTLIKGLCQIKPGELLIYNKSDDFLRCVEYFSYYPYQKTYDNSINYIQELDKIFNNIFKDLINCANGKEIWLALSGGLDSRFIASKMVDLGYKNLITFTYGPRYNQEAKEAKKIANILCLKWHFIPSSNKKAKKLFQSSKRKAYWDYSDGLCSIPQMNDYQTLYRLIQDKTISKDAIIVNGQSGDFITGGHIPSPLLHDNSNVKTLLELIIQKHYSVFNDLNHNQISILEKKILLSLKIKINDSLSNDELCALFEKWEWRERQAKIVVNAVRCYDFFEFKWQLPLWDVRIMDFYKTIPLELRYKQKLFKEYLIQWNYSNLFSEFYQPRKDNFFGIKGFFIKVIVKLSNLFGINPKLFIRYMSYFSHYNDLYSLFGFSYFIKNINNSTLPTSGRGVTALSIKWWFKENQRLFK